MNPHPRMVLDRVSTSRRSRYAWPAHYLLALAAAVAVGLTKPLLGEGMHRDVYLLLMFAVTLLASVIGGLGPGLLVCAAAFVMVRYFPTLHPAELDPQDLNLLIVQGVILSVAGGLLRAARRKADERLAANLQLEQQIVEIGDDERRRIGHDLHDGLGQHLTGISLLTETISRQIQSARQPAREDVEKVTRLVSESVGITRNLAKSLSPVTLERDGLIAAMEELAESTSSLLNISCKWNYDGPPLQLDITRSLHLFRIVQEAISNSKRHGKARNVEIRLLVNEPGKELALTVTDDGRGLSRETVDHPGLGLRIMQYRARMLGASLTAERVNAVGGTIVKCVCPFEPETPDSATPNASVPR